MENLPSSAQSFNGHFLEPSKNKTKENRADIFMGFLKNLSVATRKEYTHACREFLTFICHDVKRPEDLRKHHLIFYKSALEEKGYANKTILKKMAAISSMCKHLALEGLVEKDITYGIKRPRSENKKETIDFSDEEVRKIFDSLNPKRYNYFQYRAILAVGFFTGLRSSEIRHLKLGDIGEVKGHRILQTVVKGASRHEVALNPFVVHVLAEHIEALKNLGFDLNDDHYLFPRLKPKENKPYSHAAFSYILKESIKASGIKETSLRRYSPHSMRATLAGHLLNTVKAPLEEVQRVLKHANPSTTQLYDKREKTHDKSPLYQIDY